MTNRHPISLSGLPVVPGLIMPKKNNSFWQRLTYDQGSNNSVFDRIRNCYTLERTEGLQGFDKVQAKLRNMGAMMFNPFALAECWRQSLTTGVPL